MENCNSCGAGRPPRNEPSPTKAYESFEDFLARLTLSDEQIDFVYREAVDLLRESYNAGHDLDNGSLDEAIACDNVALYNRLADEEALTESLIDDMTDETSEPYEDVYLGRDVTIHLEPGETITVVGSDGDTLVLVDAPTIDEATMDAREYA